MLKVGVIGVGHLGRHHARIYAEMSSCELACVHDAVSARAMEVADEFGTSACAEMRDLLDRVDAVSVAVPTSDHHRVAMECLEAGVHVLVEKPIAATVDQAAHLVQTARERGLTLQVGHVERFNPAIRGALRVLSEPKFIEAHRLGVFVPRGTDVAVVLDLMIHDVDLILATVASGVVSIDAVGVPVLTPSVDIANARLNFEDGCVANVTASRVSREPVRKIRFFQSDAYVSVDCLAARVEVFRRRHVSDEMLRRIAAGEVSDGLSEVVDYEELPLDDAEPLRLELESFVEAVESGARPVVDGEDGLRALEVVLEILAQIRGREVRGWPRPGTGA